MKPPSSRRRRSRAAPALRLALLLAGLLLARCANDDARLGVTALPPAGTAVSFRNDVQTIITAHNCASFGCHNDSALGAPMSLETTKAYGNLVNVPSCEAPALKRVEPGSSGTSYLVDKIAGTQGAVESAGGCSAGCPLFTAAGSCGLQMPPLGSKLTGAEVQVIRDWIDQGAKDN